MEKKLEKTAIWTGAVLVVLCIFFGGLFLGRNQFPNFKIVDNSELNKVVDSITVENDSLRAVTAHLTNENDNLGATLDSVNEAYSRQRKRPITQEKELAERLVKKGNEDFGDAGNNPTTVTALSFGNQYADNYRLQKRQIENQKIIIVTQGIVDGNKDIIIKAQGEVIKQFYERRDKVKTKVGYFLAGLVIGRLIPL